MKKTIVLVTLLLFVVTSAFAVTGGNARKGKHLYKKNCKICHDAIGEKEVISPMSKTMSQWDRYFKRGFENHPAGIPDTMPEKDIKDIEQFLHDGAADSPAPSTCG